MGSVFHQSRRKREGKGKDLSEGVLFIRGVKRKRKGRGGIKP